MSWAPRRSRGIQAASILLCAVTAVVSLCSCGNDAKIDCAIDRGPCSTSLAETGITVTLDVTPKPLETMKTLVFRIDLKKGAIPVTDGEVRLGLSMPGMTMAENIVKLTHRGGGTYEGRGVIVRCPSGDVWQAEARVGRLSAQGAPPRRARFTFRVK
jgi:hypothetical protein